MSTGFFSFDDKNKLIDVSQMAFESEDALQTLVAEYPQLLSGDEGSAAGISEWLFVAREMGIPSEEGAGDRWAVDHLFLDREGVPTLVEVKRSTDGRIRREVVGQLLDYAANASIFWPMENIRDSFVSTCNEGGLNADEILSEFLSPDGDPELFWDRVKTNLQAGKLRLIFLADELPVELRRVIEFLNRQMDPTEVIGIEIKQYGAGNFKALTSRTVGRTANVVQRMSPGRLWNEESFLKAISERGDSGDDVVASRLLEWARRRNMRVTWGRGRINGSCYPLFDFGGTWYSLFAAWTDSQIEIQFGTLRNRTLFEEDEPRLELLNRINAVPSVQIEPSRIAGYPKIPFAALKPNGHLDQFLEAFEWVISIVENNAGASP